MHTIIRLRSQHFASALHSLLLLISFGAATFAQAPGGQAGAPSGSGGNQGTMLFDAIGALDAAGQPPPTNVIISWGPLNGDYGNTGPVTGEEPFDTKITIDIDQICADFASASQKVKKALIISVLGHEYEHCTGDNAYGVALDTFETRCKHCRIYLAQMSDLCALIGEWISDWTVPCKDIEALCDAYEELATAYNQSHLEQCVEEGCTSGADPTSAPMDFIAACMFCPFPCD